MRSQITGSRLTSSTAGGKTLVYEYDAAGNRTRTSWPDGFYTTAGYDALGRTSEIKENGTVSLASYAWDDLGRRSTVTLGNGTTVQRTYDAQGAMDSLKNFLASSAQEVQYGYTRNQLRELKTASWSNNAYGWTAPAPGTQSFAANGLNQYTAAAGSTLSYDASGNLAGDGTWAYGYDLDNRLTSANKSAAPAVSAALSYDAQGRLRQTTIGSAGISLLYDGQRLLAEYDSTSGALLRRYVHGPGADEPIVWYEGAGTTAKGWLYADHLGSIVAVANSAGASTATYCYGPYGEPDTLAGAMRFRYTGQQLIGELGLYHYKARAYSPALGRFLQTDPIGYLDDMNLYAYVGGNPANRSDPSGLQANSVYAPGGNKGVIVAGGTSDLALRILQLYGLAGAAQQGSSYDPMRDIYTPASGSLTLPSLSGPLGFIVNAIQALGRMFSEAANSPEVKPSDVSGKTSGEIDQLATGAGLVPKGPDPQNGKGAYIDPATGDQRILVHGDHAHVNDAAGNRLDINGNVVPSNSPAAHLPTKVGP